MASKIPNVGADAFFSGEMGLDKMPNAVEFAGYLSEEFKPGTPTFAVRSSDIGYVTLIVTGEENIKLIIKEAQKALRAAKKHQKILDKLLDGN